MAARTIIGTGGTGLVNLKQDGSTALTLASRGQAIDATNGNYVQGDTAAGALLQDPRGMIVQVTSAAAGGSLIVRASGNGVDINGNAQVSPYPSNAVFVQGAVGDLTVPFLTGTATVTAGPFTPDRFQQPDGNIYLDWVGGSGATVCVYQLPTFNVV